MKSKILVSILASLLIVLSLAIALPNVVVSDDSLEFTQSVSTQTFTITNPNTDTLTVTYPATLTVAGTPIQYTIGPASPFDLDQSANQLVTVTRTNADVTNLAFGEYTANLNLGLIDISGTANKSVSLKFTKGFCDAGAVGNNLSISKIDIDNQGNGDDDNWELLDDLVIEVEVENTGDDEIQDVFVEIGLFDSSGADLADDLDFSNQDEEQVEIGDINDGDEEIAEFTFKLPADFDTGNYKLAVKAFSKDLGESNLCTDTDDGQLFQTINVDSNEDDDILFDDVQAPGQVTCGETVPLSFDVFNTGSNEEDQVKVLLQNTELGVNEEIIIKNLDEGDDDSGTFSFAIPQNAQEKSYTLELTAFWDFDEPNDYDDESENPESFSISVLGCSDSPDDGDNGQTSNLDISASLDSDAVAGQELVVEAVISNLGQEPVSLILSANGYESWADLDSVSPQVITLASGDSATAEFTFIVDEDAEDSQSFFIQTNANGNVETQEVEVEIESSQVDTRTDFSSLFGGSSLIWIIALINIVLIVLIIVVAVRLARK